MPDTIILTPVLRAEMTDALTDAINDDNHGDHRGYLATLAETPDGTDLSGHELEDVVHYFAIETES